MEVIARDPNCYFSSAAGPVFIVVLIILAIFLVLILTAIKILISCKIFSKAGYSWALGMLTLLPIVDIVVACFLAFADWPIQKELRQLKQQQIEP